MKKCKLIALALAMLLLLPALAACGKSSEKISIVMAGPLTGSMAQWGETMKNGVTLAVEEWNEKGGVLGREITVDFEDDQGDPTEAASVAQKIVSKDIYSGVIGHYTTGCTLAASPTYQGAGLPEVAVASTNPGSTGAGDYIFRVNPTNTAQGRGIINWVLEQGKSKIAIFYVNNDYGKGMFDIAKGAVSEGGGTLVYDAAISAEGEDDYSVLLNNVISGGADALVLLNYYADNAKIVMQADTLGMDLLIASSDGAYSPDFINIAGDAANGVYVATWFHPDSDRPTTQTFLTAYEERFGVPSDTWAPYAYDATNILLQAIERAGAADNAKIRDELKVTANYNGVTGDITFDDERVPDTSKMNLLFTEIVDGNFQLLK